MEDLEIIKSNLIEYLEILKAKKRIERMSKFGFPKEIEINKELEKQYY